MPLIAAGGEEVQAAVAADVGKATHAWELAQRDPRAPSSSFDPHIFVCECTE